MVLPWKWVHAMKNSDPLLSTSLTDCSLLSSPWQESVGKAVPRTPLGSQPELDTGPFSNVHWSYSSLTPSQSESVPGTASPSPLAGTQPFAACDGAIRAAAVAGEA